MNCACTCICWMIQVCCRMARHAHALFQACIRVQLLFQQTFIVFCYPDNIIRPPRWLQPSLHVRLINSCSTFHICQRKSVKDLFFSCAAQTNWSRISLNVRLFFNRRLETRPTFHPVLPSSDYRRLSFSLVANIVHITKCSGGIMFSRCPSRCLSVRPNIG